MKTSAAVSFDPVAHAYRICDRDVPSVTRVLRDLLPFVHASQWHLDRGQAVHACAAALARGQKIVSFDPQIAGQVQALERFFGEVRPFVLAVEQQVYSVRHRFAGTLDLLAGGPDAATVVDFKSSLGPSVPFQVAAYALALEEMDPKRRVRWGLGVEIREDGTYRLSETYDLKLYKSKFLALLSAYNSRRECGIKEEGRE